MKATLSITAAILALAVAVPAYAETPQNVPGTKIEGNAQDKNAGALTAPEANKSTAAPAQGGTSGDAAANIPGTKVEGNSSETKPSLSGDNSASPTQGKGESGGAA